ncbi:MAG: YkvA family protein [Proteobacteria bacterium]|nr:YkvA family protein [Pseudomonadota bacterium]
MKVNEIRERWKRWTDRLKVETYAIYLAIKDPRTPWYARLLAVAVVGYAFSPIDLIPDFIPVLGYLDDLVLIPLGIILVRKLIPEDVLADCREKSREAIGRGKPTNWIAAGVIIIIWLLMAGLIAYYVIGYIRK